MPRKRIPNFTFNSVTINGHQYYKAYVMNADHKLIIVYGKTIEELCQKYDEAELKEALMANIQKLLLELGNGFAFMGKEYRMVVGGDELYCDMLFYNTHIHSYIITEVKTQKFEPSFLGQLSGYVSCANHILKREGDNDTIGLLICKSKNEVMARYSLEGFNQPLGISEYELSKVFPKDFKGSLPSIEDIENELK